MKKTYDVEERPKKALLVSFAGKKSNGHADTPDDLAGGNAEDIPGRELESLVRTLELDIIGHEIVRVRDRQPKFGMGSGKAGELSETAKRLEADCMVIDGEIGPSQQRNWEELAGIPVLDRQELIIQIFAMRAATREADLQVRLAELNFRLPRLTHKYIDLSRQRGGRYGTRGAGETKLETDRRQIEKQIHKLENEIEIVEKGRQVQRRQRERQGLPVCAVVGYTNAGKSSLVNALTGAAVYVEDKLFATLDTTTRRFEPVPGMAALLTDTVGFIRRLPHSLIKAFRSTLEEAARANLLIHVLDASDSGIENCRQTTVSVLQELGAGEIPVITVLNKCDLLDDAAQKESLLARFPESLAVSVKKGDGLEELKCRIAKELDNIAHGKEYSQQRSDN
jgi:GTP-binding protein HflX